MAILVASEATLFGGMVASWFYLRFQDTPWPPPGIPRPELVVPLVLALVLASTSLPMLAASRAAQAGRLAATRALVLGSLVVQAGYFAMEVRLYQDDLQKFRPQAHAYASLYYLLLGADHGHVAVGLLLSVWLLWKLRRGLTRYRVNATRAIAFYWVAVNALTLLVIGTILSARA
jgi:heme/copper-type cytochrome/quinol oxidase subunit 3